jgi:hypothetical protein
MKTLKLTADDFKQSDSYWKDYIGTEDVADFKGNIEIAGQLGYVRFTSLKAEGYIVADAGSGIEAGEGIKAGSGIEAGWGIEAGEGIKAGSGIEAGWGIKAGEGIKAGLSITCKLVLKFNHRLFAGLAISKKTVLDEEKTVTCGELKGGTVEYGIVKELGIKK